LREKQAHPAEELELLHVSINVKHATEQGNSRRECCKVACCLTASDRWRTSHFL